MDPRFAQFPRSLAEKSRTDRFPGPKGDIPVLLAHPDWERPAPTVLWMHGRTVNKELDPGRYLRWMRAGIAAVAIDLPGHGERYSAIPTHPRSTLQVIEQMVREIDSVVEALTDPRFGPIFDIDRLAIGGMSAGGMATLLRLCSPHTFTCAAVEGTSGFITGLYCPEESLGLNTNPPWGQSHDLDQVRAIDPISQLAGFRPIPLLALHSESDRVVPVALQRYFLKRLGEHYETMGVSQSLIELKTWPQTGAPEEHNGFGKMGNEAKNAQVDFLVRHLKPTSPN